MRLFEISSFRETILQECKPFFDEIGGYDNWITYTLWHGTFNKIKNYNKITINQEREPRNTNIELHWQLIEDMKSAGFEAHRGNSIFCSSIVQAREYGVSNIFLPIGEFNFSWSPKIRDLFSVEPIHIMINMGLAKIDPDKFDEDYTQEQAEQDGVFDSMDIIDYVILDDDLSPFFKKYYRNNDLKAAVKSQNEIMVNCQEGYLISEIYFEDEL